MSQQRYKPEFKDEAVRQVTEKGPFLRMLLPVSWSRATASTNG